jgi:Skp family chaperone for outer membrane proteins
MSKKFLFLFLIFVFFASPALSAETTEVFNSNDKHEDYKKLVREKTRSMKNDAKAIKQAISDDFKSSTEELNAEYKKLEKLYDEFKADMISQQKNLTEQKADLTRKFDKRQKDLEELIHTILAE